MRTVLDWFEDRMGATEYDPTVSSIITKFYGTMKKVAWCAVSMSIAAEEIGILDQLGGRNQGVYEMGEACKKLHANDGRFFEYPNIPSTIKKGDILFFERDGASHVSIAYYDTKYDKTKDIICLGGNQNDAIRLKGYAMRKLHYVYRPVYEEKETYCMVELPVLKKGMNHYAVMNLKRILKARGWSNVGAINSKFDDDLEKVVKKFQKKHGLEVDGHVGKQTWKEVISML